MENQGKNEIFIKINGKKLDTTGIKLTEEEIELLKKVLINNKMNLCPSCIAKVCLADRKTLNGAVFEGMSSSIETIITKCPNYRKGL